MKFWIYIIIYKQKNKKRPLQKFPFLKNFHVFIKFNLNNILPAILVHTWSEFHHAVVWIVRVLDCNHSSVRFHRLLILFPFLQLLLQLFQFLCLLLNFLQMWKHQQYSLIHAYNIILWSNLWIIFLLKLLKSYENFYNYSPVVELQIHLADA